MSAGPETSLYREPGATNLVVGVGNVLLRDDGVGVEVVRALDRLWAGGAIELPAETLLVDGGTVGLDLLPLFEHADRLVLVDAADLGLAPGAVVAFDVAALGSARVGPASLDRPGVTDLLAAAGIAGVLPESVTIVAIQPDEIRVGLGLGHAARAAVPVAVDMAVHLLRGAGPDARAAGTGASIRGHCMTGAAA